MSFEETLERVATKGGITGEGAEVIRASVPDVFDEVFERTLKNMNCLQNRLVNRHESLKEDSFFYY